MQKTPKIEHRYLWNLVEEYTGDSYSLELLEILLLKNKETVV